MPTKTAKRRTRVPGEANRSIYQRTEASTGKTVYEIGVRNAKGNQTFRTAADKYKLTATRVERDNLLGARGRGAVVVANARLTFSAAADGWLSEQVADLAPNTRASYRNSIEQHLRPRWGRRRLDRISVDDAARLVRELRAEGKAETTIASIIVAAGRVFRFAKRRLGSHAENPIALLDSGERARLADTPRRRYFSAAELDATIAAAEEPWRLPFVVASVTGARQSEIAAMHWDDWDLADIDSASVRIDYQIDRRGKRVKLKTPESRRVVDVPRFVAMHMVELKARSQYSQPEHFCFCTRSGRPYSQRNLSRELRRAQTKAVNGKGKPMFPLLHVKDEDGKPVKPVRNTIPSWHGFRHSMASEAIADGDSIEDVADTLGHRSTIVTETIYRHQIKSAERSAARRAKLEQRYGSRMAASDRSERQPDAAEGEAEVVNLQAKRRRSR
jgi:integrase